MLAVNEAQARLLALGQPLDPETIAVGQASDRYLVEAVAARRDQPPADNSAMDGYAIRFDDLPGPWRLIGESRAGHPFGGRCEPGSAVAIATGALIPAGADSVLVREDAAREKDHLRLTGEGPAERGKHIRSIGGDFRRGNILLGAGQQLTPGALALAIASGVGTVTVGRQPRLAILSTGSELAAPGSDAAAHQVFDSNGPMLGAMAAPFTRAIRHVSAVEDDEDAVRAAIRAAADVEVLLTIGGASIGEHDHVKAALEAEGAHIDFWRVAIKPGKPLLAGKADRQVVLGLPGNPGSAFVTAIMFLLPLLRHLGGARHPMPALASARLLNDLPEGGDRTEYVRAALTDEGLRPLTGQSSGLIASLSAANALIPRTAWTGTVKAGTVVRYISLD